MKALLTLLLFASACADCTGATVASVEKMNLTGSPLPEISHVIDMKTVGDTLYFVYETPEGYGQRFLRYAIIDKGTKTLNIRSEIGKRDNGYYQTDMPSTFVGVEGRMKVVSQDNGEFFTLADSTKLVHDKRYLFHSESALPFPISSYVQDVFQLSPESYLFRGRKPKGGSQYALIAKENGSRIDSLCRISVSPEYTSWTVNAGEMMFSHKTNKIAYAYRLHPVIEFFNADGSKSTSVSVCEPTFDRATIDEADFEELNPLHFLDLTQTAENIYALYWGCKYTDAQSSSIIYRFDWNGNVLSEFELPFRAKNISSYTDNSIISWDGDSFMIINL